MKDLRVLFITNQDPNGVGGGEFASHAHLRAFSEISRGNIDICIADNCRDMDPDIKVNRVFRIPPRGRVHRLLSPFTGELHRYTRAVEDIIKKHGHEYNLCVLDHSLLCSTLIPIVKAAGLKIVVIHHNFEREYFSDNITNPVKRKLLVRLYVASEKKGYQNSDINLFLTKDDLSKSESAYGKTKSRNRLLGTFEFGDRSRHPIDKKSFNKEITYIITGSMNYPQGIDGVKYFVNDLYRYIPQDSKIIIAGKSPTAEVKELCNLHPNIQLVPSPKSMNEILERGDIYICPTRTGGGLKLRVMDGLKTGMPAIVHSCSARGYDMFFNTDYFKVFETQEEFAKAVKECSDKILQKKISKEEVITEYNKFFSYEAGKERIKNYLAELNL